MFATAPEHLIATADRVALAAAHRFAGEHEDVLGKVCNAVASKIHDPDDIIEYLSIARGCFAAAEAYRRKPEEDPADLAGGLAAFGQDLLNHAMKAFSNLPQAEEIRQQMSFEYAQAWPGVCWLPDTWMSDLAYQLALSGHLRREDVLSALLDSGTRTYWDLCELLIAIRVCHASVPTFQKRGDDETADRFFELGQSLMDKAAETYGWLMADAAAYHTKQ